MKNFFKVGILLLVVSTLVSACSIRTVGDIVQEQQTENLSYISTSITNCGYDTGTDPAISITNSSDKLMQVFVTIGVNDATGTQVDTKILIETVPGGKTANKSEWNNGAYVEGATCAIIDTKAYTQ
jgi:pyruvate/oxaloacetate carboxyltransferase